MQKSIKKKIKYFQIFEEYYKLSSKIKKILV